MKPTLLIVDDLEDNLLALDALLRRDDATVLKARSGRKALELLLVHEVALALVDVQMPEMDGFELAELMRGAERTRTIPLIFVTAGTHDQHRIFRGYEAGAVDFLYKPLDAHVLRSKVGVFLQLSMQRQQLNRQVEELKRAEQELREADRRKDEFMAMLSHELRNPLMPIRNSLYVLKRLLPADDPRMRRVQEVMERQTDHLSRLVDELLDMTRISRGKVQLHLEPADLCECVRRTVDDYRAVYAANGVGLHITMEAAPVWIRADVTRLAQLVGNLLGNAVKFTPRGGQVTLSVGRDGGHAVVGVTDTGVGIAPAMLSRIFEPFSQADRTLDRSRGGLGLGLALVKGVVELHGGTVTAHSEGVGLGARFTVRFPLDGTRVDGVAVPKVEQPREGQRHKILVIEDNKDSADSLRTALELMGHKAEIARDGMEGLARAEAFLPDVVLCDIGLPGVDGYEVARRLRQHPRLRLNALVAVTGYALPDDLQRAEEAGFTHHLAKPPSLDALDRLLSGVKSATAW